MGAFIGGLILGVGIVAVVEAIHYLFRVRHDRVMDLEFHWRRNRTDVARPGSAEHFHRVFGHKE